MKVFVAWEQVDYDVYELRGVYTSIEKGNEILRNNPNINYKEFELF
jgi:hypothetical protein